MKRYFLITVILFLIIQPLTIAKEQQKKAYSTKRLYTKKPASINKVTLGVVAVLEPKTLNWYSSTHPVFKQIYARFSFVELTNGYNTMAMSNIILIKVSGDTPRQRLGSIIMNLKPERKGTHKYVIKIHFEARSIGRIKIAPWASNDSSLTSQLTFERDKAYVLSSKPVVITEEGPLPGITNTGSQYANEITWTLWDDTPGRQQFAPYIKITKITIENYPIR